MRTKHTVYEVSAPGRRPEVVKRWSQVFELARQTGWQASCTQLRYDGAGDLIDKIEIDPYHIEQDYMERAR